MRFLRTNTAVIVTVGPFYDKTDGVTIETALTITNERITLTADTDDNSAPTNILDNVTGATSGTSNDLNYITGNDAGMMQLELSAANTNRLGRMLLSITDANNHVPVFHEFMVVNAALYDAFFASSGGAIPNVAAGAANGLLISGSNTGPMSISGGVTFSNSGGSGLTCSSSGSNGHGIVATGNGSGEGISATGGATGSGIEAIGGATSGSGINATAGATTGNGITAQGTASGEGIKATGGATGNGIEANGGATSGHGLVAAAANNGDGIVATGVGTTRHGVNATGGSAGNSTGIVATGGNTGPGIYGIGGATGAGIRADGGATSGAGFHGTSVSGDGATFAGGTNGHGIGATGAGSGDGMQLTAGGTGVDLDANITGDITGTLTTVTTATNVTTVNGLAANVITATSIQADAITDAKVAADVTIASVTGAVGSVTGNVGGNVTGSVGSVAANGITASSLAADASTEIRSLASGTSDSGTTTTMVDAARTEADTDYWKGSIIVFTSGNILGQARLITGFDAGTDTITFAPATTQSVGTQTYEIWPAGRADVNSWLGTTAATPSVAGVPEVDLTHVNGAAQTATLDTIKTETASIQSDTNDLQTQIGTAGAGLTNINLPDQTMNITGDITGNLSGSVGSVTGNVGGTINGLTATALKDFFDTDSTTTYASAVAGSVVKEIADNAGGSSLTAADIADAVWEEPIADHSGTAGSTAEQLAAAGAAGDPWATPIPGAYGAGTAGNIVGNSLDATISSRASQSSVNTIDDFLDTEIASIQADTDDIQSRLPAALVGGRIDANVGAISSDATAADNAEAFFDGTGYAGTNNVIPLVTTTTTATNVTTVNGLAANVITAASMAADASGEIADAVWDEDATAHQTQGTFGQAIGDPVADTNTIFKAVVTDATGATVGVDVAAVLDDTGTSGVALADNSITAAKIANAAIDAATFATGAIDAAALAADAGTEIATAVWASGTRTLTALDEDNTTLDLDATIRGAVGLASANLDTQLDALPTAAENADAVWDEDATAHQTQGTFGQAIGDPAADTNSIFKAVVTDATGATVGVDVVAVKAETASIQSDTNDIQTRLPAALVSGRMDASVGAMAANTLTAAATAADFTTEIQTGLATQASVDVIDTNVDSILDDTGTSGVVLNAAGLQADAVTEIVTAVGNLTITELAALPGASPAMKDAIALLYMAIRNRRETTATDDKIENNAGSAIATATLSDDGTTFTKGKYA